MRKIVNYTIYIPKEIIIIIL